MRLPRVLPGLCVDKVPVIPTLRLLLVEDSEDDAALVVRTLSRGGYDVVFERVDTPQGLERALATRTFDLAIADYTMPHFSGTTALRLLRARDADLPFIFVSGTIGEDAAVVAMKSGAHDYIMKGSLKRLVPAVDRELREAAVRRDRRRVEQRLEHLAYHDPLTDLPNRALLHDRLEQAARAAVRDAAGLALLVLDLDGFKEINDTLGHHAGDLVLQHVASRLRATLRDVDTVARLGGDEFAIVLPDTDADGAVRAARKLLQEIGRACIIDNRSLMVRASVGIATLPDHGGSADTLLQKADVAMYVAKTDGTGAAVYSAERDRHTHRRLALISDLRRAVDERQFVVEYQPILNLRTGLITGVEALVRWNHPSQGRLLPADFIHIAEQTGLINPLTTIVLDEAIAAWTPRRSVFPLSVSVNLSPRSLQNPDLPMVVADLLRAAGTPPALLTLEITENILMADPARSMDCLAQLHAMGVRLAIDDFGTGYSSLSYLRRLAVDELKIDRSFIAGLGVGMDEVIVRSTIDLAHNLGLTVVAEGVESDVVQAMLAAMGCDLVQGIHISAPASLADTRHWIAQRNPLGQT
jgi:diguanylate cyclase (GGDEF)-like protein